MQEKQGDFNGRMRWQVGAVHCTKHDLSHYYSVETSLQHYWEADCDDRIGGKALTSVKIRTTSTQSSLRKQRAVLCTVLKSVQICYGSGKMPLRVPA
jgi:hypothetical protein